MDNESEDLKPVLEFCRMSKYPFLLVSRGNEDSDLHSRYGSKFTGPPGCEADVFKKVQEWEDATLEIKWNSEKKEFDVIFRGQGMINVTIENLLSKTVPLYIANSSICECGKSLQLGDYRIFTSTNDFTFEGNFFCRECKAKTVAETSGLRHFISTWYKGLKKVQVTATGLEIERE